MITKLILNVVFVRFDETLDGMNEARNTAYTPDDKYSDVEEHLVP